MSGKFQPTLHRFFGGDGMQAAYDLEFSRIWTELFHLYRAKYLNLNIYAFPCEDELPGAWYEVQSGMNQCHPLYWGTFICIMTRRQMSLRQLRRIHFDAYSCCYVDKKWEAMQASDILMLLFTHSELAFASTLAHKRHEC